ncbi:MAG: ATP-binding protein [Coriobacteriia bacterium]
MSGSSRTSCAEAETSAAEGSGLGLAIAVRLARLLGGTLELTAASSEGSTFRLTLPSVSTDPEGADAHS